MPSIDLRALPDPELQLLLAEGLAWRKSGFLTGDALKAFSEKLDFPPEANRESRLEDTLDQLAYEGARRFVQAEAFSQVAKWLAFTAPEVHQLFLAEFQKPCTAKL